MQSGHLLELGRRSFDERVWDEAYEHLAAADAEAPLDPHDLELLAAAAHLTGHDRESDDAWTRAHREWLRRDELARAVRCAFWLGFSLIQRGEMAQGGGWWGRARHLVGDHGPETVDQGYLLLPEGLAAMGSGDPAAALLHFDRARDLARRFADADLAALAAIGRGESLLRLGHAADGMAQLDEAMVSVTAGETSAVVAGIVYCAVIAACHQAFDLQRADEWTTALDRWCDGQPGLVLYRGQCLVHRAQVFQLRGAWAEALGVAEEAQRWLTDPPHPAVGLAHYQLAELRRLRGELQAAEEAYRAAHRAGHDPQPGLALLRLTQNRVDAALAAISTALDTARGRLERAQLLPAYVEIMLAAGRLPEAQAAADELTLLAGEGGGVLLAALAAQARASVLLAEGESRPALEPLRGALQAWHELDAPYQAAQVRVLLAAAYRRLDDHDRAELEGEAARRVFAELGAEPALGLLDQLAARPPPSPVTDRELQVLRLVASGRTNREIAAALVISEKTVERHLSNAFTKLGVSNRAAATAYVYDHGLV